MGEDRGYAKYLNKNIEEVDNEVSMAIRYEEERQCRRFILIPSESIAPLAVRQALGSVFTNIYAEGYPSLRMTREEHDIVLDKVHQMTYYRRYSDRRFYKGTEYADFVEVLAQQRCAQLFASATVPADHLHVNVQPLSGSPANLAVYQALMKPGDTLMGLDLYLGGHLTHGSEFNLSGKLYNRVCYGVDPKTNLLDYDAILALAKQHRPKVIVAGFTSYPYAPDWAKFRAIADEVGAYLMADIAHTAGLAVAGEYPNPVGYADVITFTTHKTICGPRGAVIMTTDEDLANRIDASVFPGDQGGPHVATFAAMAVAFKLAQTEEFRQLMRDVVVNARSFGESLASRGLKLAYGGTDTHLLLVDLRAVKTKTGFPLRGEMAARILDLCGIVVNKNTIPGDEVTSLASGIRMGTPWLTQRGFKPADFDRLAEIMARIILNIQPFRYEGITGELPRGKIDLDILEQSKREIDELALNTLAQTEPCGLGYPHFQIVPEAPKVEQPLVLPAQSGGNANAVLLNTSDKTVLHLAGWRVKPFVQQVSTANTAALQPNQVMRTFLLDKDGKALDDVTVLRLERDAKGRDRYLMLVHSENSARVKSWLRGLSDGYVLFDEDIFRKVEGPAFIEDSREFADPKLQLVSLALAGAEAGSVLQKAGVPALVPGAVWQGELFGAPLTVARADLAPGAECYELLTNSEQVANVWNGLIQAGAASGDQKAEAAARAAAGLPDYGQGHPAAADLHAAHAEMFCLTKPYFVGQASLDHVRLPAKPQEFSWSEPADASLKRTPLYEEHRKKTNKLAPFGGWEMPLWYTSVMDEHYAVRRAAGLFDVAHMGTLDIIGDHAASFLDVVSTNYARWIDPGQSTYSYLLGPDGEVLDDIMIYRIAWDHYFVIVNASNAEKDLAWLRAVNARQVVIDRKNPAREIEGEVLIRDLKDPASGDDQRVDLALQGPNSLAILQSLTSDQAVKETLAHVRRTDHARVQLSGFDVMVFRTGYTGEEYSFELLIHPDRAVEFWRLLLERGEPFGCKPCGLAARDSTRIEAGLPLYGHELAGPFNVFPSEAGFGGYIKLHKPFFVGRDYCMEMDRKKDMKVVRFKVNEPGMRAIRHGDAVANKRGQYIGRVTSCTLVGSRQIGLAYVEARSAERGAELALFPSPHGPERPEKPLSQLSKGDRVTLPVPATVVTRFPTRAEKAVWGKSDS